MFKATAVVVVSLVISACGGGNGAASPTAPTSAPSSPTVPNANQWQAVLLVSLAVEPASNIRVVEFLLNGSVEERQSFVIGGIGVPNPGLTLLKSLPSGRHTLAARIIDQVRSPGTYQLAAFAQFTRNRESISFECPLQKSSVLTGGQVTCTFTLP